MFGHKVLGIFGLGRVDAIRITDALQSSQGEGQKVWHTGGQLSSTLSQLKSE